MLHWGDSLTTAVSHAFAGERVIGLVILLIFHISLFCGAYWFFEKQLYRDYEVKYTSTQYLFALTFTACISMLQLLLLELLNILDATLRRWVWNTNVLFILSLVYVILPVAFVHTLVTQHVYEEGVSAPEATVFTPTRSSLSGIGRRFSHLYVSKRTIKTIFGSFLLLPCVWFFFYQIGKFLLGAPVAFSTSSITEPLLTYMGLCGVTIVSTLAGFGSVNYPYKNIYGLFHPVKQSDISEMEYRVTQIMKLLSEKKQQCDWIKRNRHTPLYPPTNLYKEYWPKPAVDHSDVYPSTLKSFLPVLLPPTVPLEQSWGRRHHYGQIGAYSEEAALYGERQCTTDSKDVHMGERDTWESKGGATRLKYRVVEEKSHKFRGQPDKPRGNAKTVEQAAYAPLLFYPQKPKNQFKDTFKFVTIGTRLWRVLSRLMFLFANANPSTNEEDYYYQLQNEIVALDILREEYSIGLNELSTLRAEQSLRSNSAVWFLHSFAGWLMVFVCSYRIVMATINVLFGRVSTMDPTTRVLSTLFDSLDIPFDVAFWAPYVSLVLMGWIIALNIRGFIDKALFTFRYFSTPISSNMLALVMSEVMTLYFSACVLLMRMYLPLKNRESLSEVLGQSLDFDAFHLHFDMVFVISCGISLVIVSISQRYKLERFKVS